MRLYCTREHVENIGETLRHPENRRVYIVYRQCKVCDNGRLIMGHRVTTDFILKIKRVRPRAEGRIFFNKTNSL